MLEDPAQFIVPKRAQELTDDDLSDLILQRIIENPNNRPLRNLDHSVAKEALIFRNGHQLFWAQSMIACLQAPGSQTIASIALPEVEQSTTICHSSSQLP